MAIHDFSSERLYVEAALSAGSTVSLAREQAHYLLNVLRLRVGEPILVFNGRDGEWRAEITAVSKRGATLVARDCVRQQAEGPDISYLFAPLKHARLDYMVQKATEMGVAELRPVMTRRTIAGRVNLKRMRANVVEAAEQCGILRVPEVCEPETLERALEAWDPARLLVFCDEEALVSNPVGALKRVLGKTPSCHQNGDAADVCSASFPPLGVLVGPEGGFAPEERERLLSKPFTVAVSLGPRILRADTAAIAVLALVNAVAGDWR